MEHHTKQWITKHAYIPEHLADLMAGLSGGETLLVHDFLCCRRKGWFALVGYPLERPFSERDVSAAVSEAKRTYRPETLSLIAPRIPQEIAGGCSARESDCYYTLDLTGFRTPKPLARTLRKAEGQLRLTRGRVFTEKHAALCREFVRRARPGPVIETLLERIPSYLEACGSALLLDARTRDGRISAFYAVDLSAPRFSVYVIGCHSKTDYVPGASDLVFSEMVRISQEAGKDCLHLGLGVNDGIRRFKQKWGGRAGLSYEMCEEKCKRPWFVKALSAVNWKYD
jgi:hypothetical protein